MEPTAPPPPPGKEGSFLEDLWKKCVCKVKKIKESEIEKTSDFHQTTFESALKRKEELEKRQKLLEEELGKTIKLLTTTNDILKAFDSRSPSSVPTPRYW